MPDCLKADAPRLNSFATFIFPSEVKLPEQPFVKE
jgi:hypothetical protein